MHEPAYVSRAYGLTQSQPRAEAFWAILKRFGYKDAHEELKGTKIYSLENVMTLAGSLHALFRSLDIWFEEAHRDDDQVRIFGSARIQSVRKLHEYH